MKLSIITINYNNDLGLDTTIKSVIQQTFTDFEYIVIDGGSTDNSIHIIKQNQDRINYWVSEKDKGIYNAMNKGILKAKGEYLLMLNSGDYLASNEVLSLVFKQNFTEEIVFGDVIWDEMTKKFVTHFPDIITFKYLLTNSLSHQSTFIRKDLHEITGLYDEHYQIISDWKFLILSICKHNCSYRHLSIQISVCPRNGISCNNNNSELILLEKNSVFKEHFSAYVPDYFQFEEMYKKLKNSKENNRFSKKNFIFKLLRKTWFTGKKY